MPTHPYLDFERAVNALLVPVNVLTYNPSSDVNALRIFFGHSACMHVLILVIPLFSTRYPPFCKVLL